MKKQDSTLLEKARELAADRAIRQANIATEQWKARYQRALTDLEIAEKRLEFVDSIRNRQQARLIEQVKASGDAVACLVLSDWHCGEKVDPRQVQNTNSFSPAICQKRVKSLWSHAAMMLDFARKFSDIRELVIWALGDFITGYIHEELRKSNYLSPTEETMLFQDMLFSGLKFLTKEAGIKSIVVICKPGNHGRTTEKLQFKDEYRNSFEFLAFQTAEKYFQLSGVQWRVEPGYHVYHRINRRDYRGHHGHAIRYKGGVGGIYVPINQKLMHWNRTRAAYRDVMGHLHQYTPMTHCIVNGSVIGYSEYSAVNGFAYEPPSQTLFVDSAKRGSILTEPIFCD